MGVHRWDRVFRGTAMALALSAALTISGQVLYVVGIDAPPRQRLELVSEVANPAVGVLVVGAALLAVLLVAPARQEEEQQAEEDGDGIDDETATEDPTGAP